MRLTRTCPLIPAITLFIASEFGNGFMWNQRVARQHVESVFGVLTNKYALSKLHQSKDEEDVKVEVGSSEYIKGIGIH